MRKSVAAIMVAGAAVFAGPAFAADLPSYPPIIEVPELPPVDKDLGGAFYLRGSAAWNIHWTKDVDAYDCVCDEVSFPVEDWGYGYSFGGGFGYETGTGLRFDATVDYLQNEGSSITKTGFGAGVDGDYSLKLRSTIALANVYYDFSLGDGFGGYGHHKGYSAGGGAFAYVGAGAGVAFNKVSVDGPAGNPIPGGDNVSLAAAGMVGVGYDFGAFTTDVGYRGLYISEVTNDQPAPAGFSSDNNFVHEVRGTVRYKF
ncbi:hypothetical protein GCM10007989_24900 [Devosia pacifica]|uniref:Outer membrane protein beta-barrel domain-containing protein n=1 Tax=Devosia pacifica TaxID=1335967 RepID=A0A918S9P2_9HYPH|nr:hypothetical protein [Devosia pacifica]GHA27970.1 hypothetical protein GCM10007989_24900 [Devosia pacifica]